MARPKITLVVSSAVPDRLKRFMQSWSCGDKFDEYIVVEDRQERSEFNLPSIRHKLFQYTHRSIDEILGKRAMLISRGDSSIKGFGIWVAYKRHADVTIVLDDNCLPIGRYTDAAVEKFIEQHLTNLQSQPTWTSTIPGADVRGMPTGSANSQQIAIMVAANIGLWTGESDLTNVEELARWQHSMAGYKPISGFIPPAGTRLIPLQQLTPFSSVNLSLWSRYTPMLYFPPMGLNTPYNNFGDIWGGLLFQLGCHMLHMFIAAGEPFVTHQTSYQSQTLIGEAAATADHERWWLYLSELPLAAKMPMKMAEQLGRNLTLLGNVKGWDYLDTWGRNLQEWVQICEQPIETIV